MQGRRSLIVTGDDFGVSHEVNLGILQAHERGVLTSASLMVAGEAFEEAVAIARAHPRLGVGLHLVVLCGRAVLPPSRIPNLVDSAGRFSSSPIRAGLRYPFSRAARRQLRLEIRAQLEKFRSTGLALSHVDGHLHMHLHPVILEILRDLSGEFGIRAVRLPREELRLALALDRSGLATKCIYSSLFGGLRWWGARRLKQTGIEFPDRVYGLLQTGRITEEYLLGLIPRMQGNRVEIYSHPTTQEQGTPPRGASRAQMEALLSEKVRRVLVSSGFELGTYAQWTG